MKLIISLSVFIASLSVSYYFAVFMPKQKKIEFEERQASLEEKKIKYIHNEEIKFYKCIEASAQSVSKNNDAKCREARKERFENCVNSYMAMVTPVRSEGAFLCQKKFGSVENSDECPLPPEQFNKMTENWYGKASNCDVLYPEGYESYLKNFKKYQ